MQNMKKIIKIKRKSNTMYQKNLKIKKEFY